MPEQAAPELLAQLRRQGDAPVRRITDDQIEAFTHGRLLQAVARPHDGPQPGSCLAAQVAQRRIEEHQRHPRRKGVALEPVQPALNALERGRGVAVSQALRHAPRHQCQEHAPATGRIEHSRRTPVDTGLHRHVQQPLAQRRRRVVGPLPRPEPGRHQSGVAHADQVGRRPGRPARPRRFRFAPPLLRPPPVRENARCRAAPAAAILGRIRPVAPSSKQTLREGRPPVRNPASLRARPKTPAS